MPIDKNTQLKKLLELMVQKEVRRVLPGMIKEQVTKMLNEVPSAPAPRIQGNGHKRVALQEASGQPEDYAEYPSAPQPAFDRAAFRARVGMEGFSTIGSGDPVPVSTGLITAPAITEHGTAIEVPPEAMPEHVLKALNTNYSGFMKAMDGHKPKP